jgi:hypothetical protein
MTPFTTCNYADISTAHVTKADAELIAASGRDLYGIIASYPEGWFCYVPADDWSPQLVETWERQGFSHAYIKLQRKLMEAGISYARFDADGYHVTSLPTFDW